MNGPLVCHAKTRKRLLVCDFDSPQREIEELEEAVGEAEVAEAEAGRVARQSHPALVVDVGSHLGIVMLDRLV